MNLESGDLGMKQISRFDSLNKQSVFYKFSGIPMKPLKILRWCHFRLAFESAVKVGQIVEPAFETHL